MKAKDMDEAKASRNEMVFAVIGLMFFNGVSTFLERAFDAGIGNQLSELAVSFVRYTVFIGSFIMLLQRWRSSLKTILRGGWVWGLILLMAASFTWAENPAVVFTGVRAEVLPTVCFGLYLATNFTVTEQFKAIMWALSISIFLSILLAFVSPGLAFEPLNSTHPGAWKGIYSHKNDFSAYMVLTAAVLFNAAVYAKQKQVLKWSLFACCIGAIILANSATGLVLSMAAVIITLVFRSFHWRGIRSVFLSMLSLFVGGGFVLFIINAWNPIMTSLGRDPTLTARTLIWDFLIDYKIPNSPILGYGRGMFWSSPSLPGGIEQAAFHVPAHAHNGFIDLVLDVGLVGLFFFVVAFIIAYAKAWRLSYLNKGKAAYQWPIVFLNLLILSNYTESFLTRLANIFWVLFITMVFTLNRENPSNL
ncbi:MAG: O-antigen ligase family protein [Cyanobacteria bacterium J06560_6]